MYAVLQLTKRGKYKKSLQPKVYKAGEDRFISVKTFLIKSQKNVYPVNFGP